MHMLNDKWTDPNKVALMQRQSDVDLGKLRESVDRLRWASVDVSSPEAIHKVSDSDIDNRIEEIKRDYSKQATTLILGADKVAEAMTRYDELAGELKSHVSTIHRILGRYDGVSIKVDSKGKVWFDEKQLKSFIEAKCTTLYNDIHKKYYSLLGQVVDALESLREFETGNQLHPLSDCIINDIRNPMSNLYDYKQEKFMLNRSIFSDMLRNGYVMQHELSEQERREIEHRMRYGN